MMPMFVSMQIMRRGFATSVAAVAKRGSIASRKGSASVMPAPRRNVRRLSEREVMMDVMSVVD